MAKGWLSMRTRCQASPSPILVWWAWLRPGRGYSRAPWPSQARVGHGLDFLRFHTLRKILKKSFAWGLTSPEVSV
jgi:hypothetical protein